MTSPRYISFFLSLLTAAGVSLLPSLGSAQTKAAKAPVKATAKSSAKKSTSKKSAKKQTKASTSPAADTRYRRSNQSKPSAERYMEIQQALHDRGYLGGPVDGNWSKDSEAALKHFQRDQNLKDDGKLGALSLMALGLGPKRPATVAQAAGSSPPPQVE